VAVDKLLSLFLRTIRRMVMAATVRFSFRAIKGLSILIPATPKAAHPPRASMVG
jgi:hypothetical protein